MDVMADESADKMNGVDNANANNHSNTNNAALDREKTCPFLLRVFCSTSRHAPIQDYNRGKWDPRG